MVMKAANFNNSDEVVEKLVTMGVDQPEGVLYQNGYNGPSTPNRGNNQQFSQRGRFNNRTRGYGNRQWGRGTTRPNGFQPGYQYQYGNQNNGNYQNYQRGNQNYNSFGNNRGSTRDQRGRTWPQQSINYQAYAPEMGIPTVFDPNFQLNPYYENHSYGNFYQCPQGSDNSSNQFVTNETGNEQATQIPSRNLGAADLE